MFEWLAETSADISRIAALAKSRAPNQVAMFALQSTIVGIQEWLDLHQHVDNQLAVASMQPLS